MGGSSSVSVLGFTTRIVGGRATLLSVLRVLFFVGSFLGSS